VIPDFSDAELVGLDLRGVNIHSALVNSRHRGQYVQRKSDWPRPCDKPKTKAGVLSDARNAS